MSIQRELTVSAETFTKMISELVAQGVTFEAEEDQDGNIKVIFTGGY